MLFIDYNDDVLKTIYDNYQLVGKQKSDQDC